MPLRDEFKRLDEKCTKLRQGKELSQEFLKEVRTHIKFCEHLAKTDEERAVITRTTYWWRKKATRFGLDMSAEDFVPSADGNQKLLPAPPGKFELTFNDKRFLRALGIKIEEEEEEDEDDGA